MARTKPTHPAPLFFADAFGVTAVDARGRARSKPAPFDLHGFVASPPYLALRTAGGALSLRDAALRTLAPPLRPPGALLPGGDDTLRLVTLDGVRQVQLGADAVPQPLPEAPLRVPLTLGVAHGPALLPMGRPPVIADDGGCARFAGALAGAYLEPHAPGPGGVPAPVRAYWNLGGPRLLVQDYEFRRGGYVLVDTLVCRREDDDRLRCTEDDR